MNWVDYAILLILVLGVVNGFREGFVRLVVGFGALIVAFFAASWLNGLVAGYLSDWITNRMFAVLAAYALIFFGVILMGGLIASLIVRAFRLVGLTPVDRVLGAGFGLVRATVGLAIAAMVLMAMVPGRLPDSVAHSKLTPYVVGTSKFLSALTPYEIRHGVEKKYSELRVRLDRLRSLRKLEVREE